MKSDSIEVEVIAQYLPEQSDPEKRQYFFIYTVRIRNNGLFAAQVISRYWIIKDGNEQVQEVRGLGVIGQQPLIAVGDTFEYTSGCPLSTPYGTMKGSYHCVGENGIPFDVDIPEFVLTVPRTLH